MRQIAGKFSHSSSWVQKWIERYKKRGVQRLFDMNRPGRKSYLDENSEASFIQRIQNGLFEKDPVSVLKIPYINQILASEFNCHYSYSGTYALLKRLNFTRIKPRPTHEINNSEVIFLLFYVIG
ncbi:MAG: transposase [Oligoflexales bacterium]|nr:transposase [Oligoflexales bacterium]